MFCDIKNIECEYAGNITLKGCPEFGEEPGLHKYPVCYRAVNYKKCILEE